MAVFLGTVSSVAAAWGLAFVDPFDARLARPGGDVGRPNWGRQTVQGTGGLWQYGAYKLPGQDVFFSIWGIPPATGLQSNPPGGAPPEMIIPRSVDALWLTAKPGVPHSHTVMVKVTGWPWPSMYSIATSVRPYGSGISRYDLSRGIPAGRHDPDQRPRALPLGMLWSPHLANIVAHVVGWLALLLLLRHRAYVRWLRVKRGRCRRCNYPVGTSVVCTECGLPVPTRSRR